MRKKLRLYTAGLVAFLLGMPLTEEAFAGTGDIVWAGLDLGFSIADLSGGS